MSTQISARHSEWILVSGTSRAKYWMGAPCLETACTQNEYQWTQKPKRWSYRGKLQVRDGDFTHHLKLTTDERLRQVFECNVEQLYTIPSTAFMSQTGSHSMQYACSSPQQAPKRFTFNLLGLQTNRATQRISFLSIFWKKCHMVEKTNQN